MPQKRERTEITEAKLLLQACHQKSIFAAEAHPELLSTNSGRVVLTQFRSHFCSGRTRTKKDRFSLARPVNCWMCL